MKLKNVTKGRKNMILNKFSPTQIGGFLPALVPATTAVAKELGLGAASYAGTKLAQNAFGDGIKKNLKKTPKTNGQGIKLTG
jgi:hypothetical protein